MSQHHDQNEAAAEQPSTALPIVAIVFFVMFWPLGALLSIISFVKYNRFKGSTAKTLAIVAIALNFGLAVPMCGILTAIAVPNFIKFQCRAKQSEAKSNLKSLYVAEEGHRAELDRYDTNLATLRFSPTGTKIRYEYTVLSATNEAFSAEARGTGDMAGDVWTIDQNNTLQNVANSCSR